MHITFWDLVRDLYWDPQYSEEFCAESLKENLAAISKKPRHLAAEALVPYQPEGEQPESTIRVRQHLRPGVVSHLVWSWIVLGLPFYRDGQEYTDFIDLGLSNLETTEGITFEKETLRVFLQEQSMPLPTSIFEKSAANYFENKRGGQPFKLTTPEGTTWHDLQLVIRNNDFTEILQVNGPEGHLGNYRPEEIGFRGHRGPGEKWNTLKLFAETDGSIKPSGSDYVKSTVSRLRQKLRELFPGIEGDPLPWQKAEKCWRPAFRIKVKYSDPTAFSDSEVEDVFTSEVEEKSNIAKPKRLQSQQD